MMWGGGGLEARRFGIAFVDKKAESGLGYTGLVGRDRRGFRARNQGAQPTKIKHLRAELQLTLVQ